MTKYLIIAVLILIVFAILSIKINFAQGKKNKELKKELEKNERIEKQKEKVNTHDNSTDFNNSINVLQEYSKRKR